ncbi:MAG TPA: nucleoside hydrolase-like domain-containing protein, partial [Verrucomicrobiae bacterium]|nr:nucleoside hydrolase-like domain-containing protein [Verrucomicrobiae bacterium]
MKHRLLNFTLVACAFLVLIGQATAQDRPLTHAVAASPRYRVIVSSDIGGSDPDDYQSMVHVLLYADTLDIEGLISTHPGGGKKAEILKVIGFYAHDYPNLKTYSDKYPTPDALRAITKQGAASHIGVAGYSKPTEGSEWIIHCA